MKKYIGIITILFMFLAIGFAVTNTAIISAQGVPQCSDGVDNDGDGGTDDTDADCHLDGDTKNPGSYDGTIWQEAGATLPCPTCQQNGNNNNNNGNGGGGSRQYICSDDLDNDGDGLVDEKDPGCHKDGDATNASSYDRKDKSEIHKIPVPPAVLGATTAPTKLQKTGGALSPRIAANQKAVAAAIAENSYLVIPKIGVNKPILSLKDITPLRSEIWKLPWTPDPGFGNTVMVAHSYNLVKGKYSVSTFYNLENLEKGDVIEVVWKGKNYKYSVTEKGRANPDDASLEKPSELPMLTLYGCGRFTNLYRVYVKAELIEQV